MRRLLPDRLKNMRDIGGIVTRSGRRINEGVFIRSNVPVGLSDADLSFLMETRLTTVIDLRSLHEIQTRKSDLNDTRFRYRHIEVKGAAPPESESKIPEGYLEIIGDTSTVGTIMETMARAPGGVIFHCNAGKDRSGVLSMLLLLYADAYDEDIIADYQVSHTFIGADVLRYLKQHPELPAWAGQSKAEYMEETLRLFRATYGTIDTYFASLSLSREDRKRLHDKMFA